MDDQKADELDKIWQAIRDLQTATPGGHATVARGQTRFEGIMSWILEGTGQVTGTLSGIGQLLWDGIVTLTSTFTAKGTTRFEGDTTQVGPLHIQGNTDLTGQMTVAPGGAILIGTITMDTGGISGSTVIIKSVGGVISLQGATSVTALLTAAAGALINGGGTVNGGLTVTGDFKGNLPSTTAVGKTPNVWIDSAGKLWKLT